jgi:hypothetical protein
MHVEVSPQSYDTHEPLVGAVNATLRALASELDVGRYFLPPSWFTHEATLLSTEPEGFLALWESLEGGHLRINPDRRTEMLGRPDMVLEVVSNTFRAQGSGRARSRLRGGRRARVPDRRRPRRRGHLSGCSRSEPTPRTVRSRATPGLAGVSALRLRVQAPACR